MKVTVFGPCQLHGQITVSGAKNSATRIMSAALLGDGPVALHNFPTQLEDVKAKLAFIRQLGASCDLDDTQNLALLSPGSVSVDRLNSFDLPVRTTYLLAAVQLLHSGRAKVPYPGGCKIGSRGYDLHMHVWQQLGCEAVEKADYIDVSGRLQGGVIDFPISTVGGTESALLCGAVASGTTIIRNAYVTPEVSDLICFLQRLGADIELEGSSVIRIRGAGGKLGNTEYSVMPDRIEALTWIILGAASGGQLQINNVPFDSLQVPLIHLRAAGIDVLQNTHSALISPACIGRHGIQPFEIACGTHPGIHTDMQSFFTFLALFAEGRSTIHDYRYPERIQYASELAKFTNATIEARPGRLRVDGPARLTGTAADSTDLRGSMCLLMAALCAEGESTISAIELALRGYNDLPNKLKNVGADCNWHS